MSVGSCELGGVVTGSLVDTGYDVTLCVTFRLVVLGSVQVATGRSVRSITTPAHRARKSTEEISIRRLIVKPTHAHFQFLFINPYRTNVENRVSS